MNSGTITVVVNHQIICLLPACPFVCMCAFNVVRLISLCADCVLQYADPVADLLDKWGVFRARLFRESCVFHRGNYVKVSDCLLLLFCFCQFQSFVSVLFFAQDTCADACGLLFLGAGLKNKLITGPF